MRSQLITGACLAALAVGCTVQPSAATEPGEQDVTGIFERVRQDVGNYEYQAAQRRGDVQPKVADPALPPPPFDVACPASVANYDFDVTKIELTLQAIAANTVSGDVGLKIPIVDATLGPDVSGDLAHTRTKTVVIDRLVPYRPSDLQKFHDGPDYANLTAKHQAFLQSQKTRSAATAALPVFPISDTLAELRKSLVGASGKLPCFDVAKNEAVGDSMNFEFQVVKAIDPTVGFSLGIVTAKADDKTQTTADNKIVVSFAPHVPAAAKPAAKPAPK
jgi:hypothetical protein